jgi:hypothetical protein
MRHLLAAIWKPWALFDEAIEWYVTDDPPAGIYKGRQQVFEFFAELSSIQPGRSGSRIMTYWQVMSMWWC